MNAAIPIVVGLILLGVLVGIIFASLALQEWENRIAQMGGDLAYNGPGSPNFRLAPATPSGRPVRGTRGGDRASQDAAGLVLSGFDTGGARLRVAIDRTSAERSRWGLTFGRDGGCCDHVINDNAGALSRRHFRVSWNARDQGFEIEDLNSSSGTKVNGRVLRPFEKIAVPLPAKIDVGGRTQLDLTRG